MGRPGADAWAASVSRSTSLCLARIVTESECVLGGKTKADVPVTRTAGMKHEMTK